MKISNPIIHPWKINLFTALVILCAVCFALLVRYPYILSNDLFPLGDGGLFMAMIESLESNNYALPQTVHFNGHDIPFTYPPLGFYLASYTARLSETSILLVARFLPLLLNFLTVIAFVFLSSELVRGKLELFIASTLFPLIFQSYEWVIKAGGVTRSAGFLFVVITLYFVCLYQKRKKTYLLALTIFFLSATILSHPEWGMVSVLFTVIYLIAVNLKELKNQVFILIIMETGTLLLTLPWWGVVISRFGINPFLMASQAIQLEESQIFDIIRGGIFLITITTSYNGLIPWLALLGVIVALYKKEFFAPFWLLSIYLITPRNIAIFGAIPVVFLVLYGLRGVHEFIFQCIVSLKYENKLIDFVRRGSYHFPLSFLYLAMIISVVLFDRANLPIVQPIPQSDRNAMGFIKENTLAEENFVVITPNNWYDAYTAEWFPYLTGRTSLTTSQGIEWVSAVEFQEIVNQVAYLSDLARSERASYETNEIIDYVESQFSDFEYVAVFIGNVRKDFGGFIRSGKYNLIYEKRDVLIFRRLNELR